MVKWMGSVCETDWSGSFGLRVLNDFMTLTVEFLFLWW